MSAGANRPEDRSFEADRGRPRDRSRDRSYNSWDNSRDRSHDDDDRRRDRSYDRNRSYDKDDSYDRDYRGGRPRYDDDSDGLDLDEDHKLNDSREEDRDNLQYQRDTNMENYNPNI